MLRPAGGVQKPAGFDLFDAEDVVPAVVFLAPRLGMFLLSLTLDAAMIRGANRVQNRGGEIGSTKRGDARIALASSWPVLVFAVRPFSNSLEACLLAVAALVTLARPRWYRWRVSGTLGFIAAIGIWTGSPSRCSRFPSGCETWRARSGFGCTRWRLRCS